MFAGTVDDLHTDTDICQSFASKFTDLYDFGDTCTVQNSLEIVRRDIRRRITSDKHSHSDIHVTCIRKAVHKLKNGKSYGSDGLCSDHSKQGTNTLFVMLFAISIALMRMILVHGHMPSQLLRSVIISIPNDKRASLRESKNYRGITLCSSIGKLTDLWIIDKHTAALVTSDMRYAFKEGQSIIMCITVLKETIAYYKAKGSNVNVFLLEASKAFDRVNHAILFIELLKRGLPAIIVRIIDDCFHKQVLCTKWNGKISEKFSATNGVKQGCILSLMYLYRYYVGKIKRTPGRVPQER